MSEGGSEGVSEWGSEWVREWVSEGVSERVSEWVRECERASERVSEWGSASEWVSEWGSASERVSEEDGRTGGREDGRTGGGGGGRSGYRTKNKNPTRQCGEKPKTHCTNVAVEGNGPRRTRHLVWRSTSDAPAAPRSVQWTRRWRIVCGAWIWYISAKSCADQNIWSVPRHGWWLGQQGDAARPLEEHGSGMVDLEPILASATGWSRAASKREPSGCSEQSRCCQLICDLSTLHGLLPWELFFRSFIQVASSVTSWSVTQATLLSDPCRFSAGSYTGRALHEVLCELARFPQPHQVCCNCTPRPTHATCNWRQTGVLVYALADRLCVWQPDPTREVGYDVVLLEGTPDWIGKPCHSYGHLLFVQPPPGRHSFDIFQIVVRIECILRILLWASFELTEPLENTLDRLLTLIGQGQEDLHCTSLEGRDVRDAPLRTEEELYEYLVSLVPNPGPPSERGRTDTFSGTSSTPSHCGH